ncbi:MoaD/ThiS family protein [Leucobacter massiliensis]|uniref:Molybdopterin synthase sulfur carrier subunit n=1 Tax=Leucobacter massiliensis TaxID=1686285 RepID=A0A2S9QM60_9MICO|nr:MoaD/ThiS family protein [Leucobacter massiliensis]PRI10671.1 molybdopterin synthase sulfur carrier subunit [Leucobacter massiliensis]
MSVITVRFFAGAAEAAGRDEEQWTPPAAATLDALRAELAERHGEAMRRVLRSGSFLVDGTVRRDGGEIRGAVVDVLPPFAGG